MGNSAVLGKDDPHGTPEALLKAKAWIFRYGWGYTLLLCVAWPLACIPLAAFGKSTFQLWVALALMWGWVGGLVIILLPIYESFSTIRDVLMLKTPKEAKGFKQEADLET